MKQSKKKSAKGLNLILDLGWYFGLFFMRVLLLGALRRSISDSKLCFSVGSSSRGRGSFGSRASCNANSR